MKRCPIKTSFVLHLHRGNLLGSIASPQWQQTFYHPSKSRTRMMNILKPSNELSITPVKGKPTGSARSLLRLSTNSALIHHAQCIQMATTSEANVIQTSTTPSMKSIFLSWHLWSYQSFFPTVFQLKTRLTQWLELLHIKASFMEWLPKSELLLTNTRLKQASNDAMPNAWNERLVFAGNSVASLSPPEIIHHLCHSSHCRPNEWSCQGYQ